VQHHRSAVSRQAKRLGYFFARCAKWTAAERGRGVAFCTRTYLCRSIFVAILGMGESLLVSIPTTYRTTGKLRPPFVDQRQNAQNFVLCWFGRVCSFLASNATRLTNENTAVVVIVRVHVCVVCVCFFISICRAYQLLCVCMSVSLAFAARVCVFLLALMALTG